MHIKIFLNIYKIFKLLISPISSERIIPFLTLFEVIFLLFGIDIYIYLLKQNDVR